MNSDLKVYCTASLLSHYSEVCVCVPDKNFEAFYVLGSLSFREKGPSLHAVRDGNSIDGASHHSENQDSRSHGAGWICTD